ncbi:MAG: serine/threonine-protein kinase [Myxococcota bacterium]
MERLGKYILVERIASGGMAEVWRGASFGSSGFSRVLAIKRLHPHLSADPVITASMVQEAKLVSVLNHPNIVEVLDLGRAGGQHFIAMEYVSGRALSQVLVGALTSGVQLPAPFCVHVVTEALGGLHHAHTRTDSDGKPLNIIHRDVSPQNILVGYDGRVLLTDFGLAKAATSEDTTRVGRVKGKPGYLSPEVLKGQKADRRVDVYAMGVVLHELFTMRPMRARHEDRAILREVMAGGFPRFNEVGVDVPDAVAQVVYRALAPNPDERWPDAQSFRDALRDAAEAQGWSWSGVKTATFLAELFADEMAREAERETRIRKELERLAAEHAPELSRVARAAAGDDVGRSARRWALIAVPLILLSGVASAVAVRSWMSPPPQPAPPSPAPPPVATPAPPPQPPPAHRIIPVDTVPTGATVRLGDVVVGTTPTSITLEAGQPVQLHLELSGHDSVRQELTAEDAPPRLKFHLVERQAAPTPTVEGPSRPSRERPTRTTRAKEPQKREEGGFLSVASRPWANVIVDGRATGLFTPVVDLPISAGRHVVRLENPELKLSAQEIVVVKPGAKVRVVKALK